MATDHEKNLVKALLGTLAYAENEVRGLHTVERKDGENCGAAAGDSALQEVERVLFVHFCSDAVGPVDEHSSWKLALRHGDETYATAELMRVSDLTKEQAVHVIEFAKDWLGMR